MSARIAVLLVALAGFAPGCSSDPGVRSEKAVDINGTATFADGKPVKDVRLLFFPTSSKLNPGHADLKADGKFAMPMFPGKYTFAFESSGNPAALKAIPADYHSNSADHAVTVDAGKPVEIVVK